MSGITVTRLENRLVAVKTGTGEDAARRRQEAAVLERLDHPGVVELLDTVEVDATQRSSEVLRRLRIFRDRTEERATLKMTRAAGLMYVSGFLNTVKWLLTRLRS